MRQMTDSYTDPLINDFVNRSFRDIADQDYLSARLNYRYGLSQQFLWGALQAVEKYLKAILLYNRRPTGHLGHDISAAYKELSNITDIPFDFPVDIQDFIAYLHDQGANRYFDRPFYTLGEELLSLDRTVWYLRRYFHYMRGTLISANGKPVDQLANNLAVIAQQSAETPNQVRICGGFLEKHLNDKTSQLREQLIRVTSCVRGHA